MHDIGADLPDMTTFDEHPDIAACESFVPAVNSARYLPSLCVAWCFLPSPNALKRLHLRILASFDLTYTTFQGSRCKASPSSLPLPALYISINTRLSMVDLVVSPAANINETRD